MDTLGVVGAGRMGSGIAQKMAAEGFVVILVDTDAAKVVGGLAAVDATLREGIERRILTAEEARAARARIRGTPHLEDLAGASLVVEAVFEDPAVRGIVIAGAGKAFVAGADVRFFVRNIEARDFDRIVRFTRAARDLLRDISRCSKPVMARVHGAALGGGLELALACHAIVAGPKATMAFPETGLGIYPALGGTQRTPRRLGIGLAKWLVLTGEAIGAEDALEIGLVDRVASADGLDAEASDLVTLASRQPAANPKPTPARYRGVVAAFAMPGVSGAEAAALTPAGDALLAQAARRLATRAPIALRIAANLIDRGAGLPIDQALDLELSRLVEIFSTRDALEGLSSLGKKRPIFVGA